jgi:hypothetical protein
MMEFLSQEPRIKDRCLDSDCDLFTFLLQKGPLPEFLLMKIKIIYHFEKIILYSEVFLKS